MSLSATPVRRLFGMLIALVLAAVGLLVMPLSALAASPAYPAPPVDPAVQAGAPVAQADPGIELASNSGSDFSIGVPLMIAALVLVVGLALLLMMTRPGKAKHRRQ